MTKRSKRWTVPPELAHLIPLAQQTAKLWGPKEFDEFIDSLTPKALGELAHAYADFRSRRLIHVFNRWYGSTQLPDPERTGHQAFLRLLIVFDFLSARGVRPFNRYKSPLVWKTARPRKRASLKLPLEFQYLNEALRKHAVLGTEEQLIKTGNAIKGRERSILLALKQRAFKDQKLLAWLTRPPDKRFKREHQLLNSLMLMLDHMEPSV